MVVGAQCLPRGFFPLGDKPLNLFFIMFILINLFELRDRLLVTVRLAIILVGPVGTVMNPKSVELRICGLVKQQHLFFIICAKL